MSPDPGARMKHSRDDGEALGRVKMKAIENLKRKREDGFGNSSASRLAHSAEQSTRNASAYYKSQETHNRSQETHNRVMQKVVSLQSVHGSLTLRHMTATEELRLARAAVSVAEDKLDAAEDNGVTGARLQRAESRLKQAQESAATAQRVMVKLNKELAAIDAQLTRLGSSPRGKPSAKALIMGDVSSDGEDGFDGGAAADDEEAAALSLRKRVRVRLYDDIHPDIPDHADKVKAVAAILDDDDSDDDLQPACVAEKAAANRSDDDLQPACVAEKAAANNDCIGSPARIGQFRCEKCDDMFDGSEFFECTVRILGVCYGMFEMRQVTHDCCLFVCRTGLHVSPLPR